MRLGKATGVGVAIAAIALGGGFARGEEPEAAKAEAPAPFASAADLLDALEASDRTVSTLQSVVVYDKRFNLQGDQHIRRGRLCFDAQPGGDAGPGRRRFAVTFDTLQMETVFRPEQQALIFDGEWLVEKREAEKQWVARRMAPPGARVDPLRLGEGPLPIPFGQARAEIMARFDVELVDAADGIAWEDRGDELYRDSVRGCWQMVFVPKADTAEAEKFREIRLWYGRDDQGHLFPRMAFTIDRKGDEAFVQLIEVRVNAPLPEGVFDMQPPEESEGWTVQFDQGSFEEEGVEAE